ncbi:CHAT domain-containing protein [Glycocaulis abyssi]|uniref:CHAT domain-containing protein n=1 Tax=Glycocaulis abyssi TaxID=1433403 RepID=A0ABV9NBR9_9PROT
MACNHLRIWALSLALLAAPHGLAQETPPLAPSITEPDARALIEAAEAIDMEQDPAGARAAWEAAYDTALTLGDVDATDRAAIINQLGSAIFYAGGREEALGLFREAADIFAEAGPDHAEALEQSLGNVASILATLGRLAEAEQVQREVMDIRRTLYPEMHVQIARSYFELGSVLNARGELDEAASLVERSLDIRREVLEAGHPHIAMTQVSLAAILTRAYRYAEAAELSRDAAEQLEANLPPGHPFISFARSSYAGALNAWGRYEAAEPLLRRILDERRASLGETHPQVADTLNNLGVALYAQGREAEARPLFLAARDIYRTAAGATSVEAARMQMNAADAAMAAGDYDTARAEWLDTLSVFEETGTAGPDRIRVLAELAALEALSGNAPAGRQRLGEARALAVSYLPESHARRHELTIDDVWIDAVTGNAMRAVPHAVDDAVMALAAELDLVDVDAARDMARSRQRAFRRALDIAMAATDREAAFRYMQLVHTTGLALAAEATALRGRAGEDGTASQVRERQDGWRALRRAEDNYISLLAASDAADPSEIADARLAYESAREELAAMAGASDTQTGTALVSLDAVRGALQPDETVIAFAFTEGGGVALRIGPDGAEIDRLAISRDEAQSAVTRLRAALEAGPSASLSRAFPAAPAHQLHEGVFTPRVRAGIEAGSRLFILADGPYRSIPFEVLLTTEYTAPMHSDEALRGAPWLIRDHGLATLASLSSLTTHENAPSRPPFLIGFGAPVFEGEPDAAPMALAALLRSGTEGLRALSALPPLPGTRAELEELALLFGPERSDVRLGMWATEAAVKTAELDQASVLVFATHGLLPGALETVSEPALAFTPPAEPGPFDDGLLTASEIAQLQLQADWVVLSACNTFAADGISRAPDRLAQAFLYAGARSLLVSHWAVRDDVAAIITAETARRTLAGESRAEAFRNAVLGVMDDPAIPGGAHPGIWGPFALIGQ